MKPVHPEVGRELKASELKPRQIVWLHKATNPNVATMWVMHITDEYVEFYAGETNFTFIAKREGDRITDNTGAAFAIYEYLGKP